MYLFHRKLLTIKKKMHKLYKTKPQKPSQSLKYDENNKSPQIYESFETFY